MKNTQLITMLFSLFSTTVFAGEVCNVTLNTDDRFNDTYQEATCTVAQDQIPFKKCDDGTINAQNRIIKAYMGKGYDLKALTLTRANDRLLIFVKP